MRRHPILFGFLITSLVLVIFLGMFALSLLMVGGTGAERRFFTMRDSVAVIEIRGLIMDSRDVLEQLKDYAENTNVKAIVLRIDSPGGSVGPCQEIYEEVLRIRDTKPIVASLGSVAASGGYYIAAGADKIVANPGTITGSIGVIMEMIDYQGVFQWAGLKSNVIKSGPFKDIGSGTRDMTREEQALLQGVVDSVLNQFVKAIVDGRHMDPAHVRIYSDGRIFSGEQAMELQFVDELGNVNTAIDLAAEMGKIEGEPNVIYPQRRESRGLFSLAFQGLAEALYEVAAERYTGEIRFSYKD